MAASLVRILFVHRGYIQGVLISPYLIANSGNQFFILVLHTNKELASLFGNVSSSELIGTYPGDSSLSALKFHILCIKGDAVAHTNFITVMTVHNGVMPYNDRVTTAVIYNILLELQKFSVPQRTD
jgi:hypothetical protein